MSSIPDLFGAALDAFERGDRTRAIASMRSLLDRVVDEDGPPGARSEIARNLANMLEAVGDLAAAQGLRRETLDWLDSIDLRAEWFGVVLDGDLGRGYEALGQMDRAAEAWERALESESRGGFDKPHIRAMVRVNATVAAIFREDWDRAQRLADESLAACERAGASELLGRARLNLQTLRTRRASVSGGRAAAAAGRAGDPVTGAAADRGGQAPGSAGRAETAVLQALNQVAALVQSNSPGGCLAVLEAQVEPSRALVRPDVVVRYWSALATFRQVAGRRWDDVISAARKAVDCVESLRGPLAAHGFSAGGLKGQAQNAYELLALGLLAQNRVDEAFDIMERVRARRLLDDLVWTPGASDSPLAARALALRAEIRALVASWLHPGGRTRYRNLVVVARPRVDPSSAPFASRPPDLEPDPARVSIKDETLAARQIGYAQLLRELAETTPRTFAERAPGLASLAQVRAALAADELLLHTLVTRTHLVTLAVTREWVVRGGVERGVASIMQLVDRCRTGLRDPASNRESLDEALDLVGAMVLGAVSDRLEGFRTILWVPSGPLADLPLAALRVGGRYLAQTAATVCLPMAGMVLQARDRARTAQLVALGNPDHADPEAALPLAEHEVEAIGECFPGIVATRDRASTANLREWARRAGVLHFACHGLFDRDHPGFSLLKLAPSSPAGEGLLFASDVPSLRLDCGLVVLSACQAGLVGVLGGDDVGGLPVAFLTGGGESVVAGLWSVDDEATQTLMVSLYRQLLAHPKGEALRRAALETRSTRGLDHPAFWSPFVLMGDWRGRVRPARA